MARNRDYKAEYRARVERAKAQGLTIGQATGHAKRGPLKLPSITELQDAGTIPKRRAKRVPKITDFPDAIAQKAGSSRLVQSSSQRTLIAEMKRAASKGQRVSFRATWDTDKGPKTVNLGGSQPHGKLDSDGVPIGKVSMTAGSDPSGNGKSYDPAEIIALLRGDYDLWAWFADQLDDGEDWYL